MQLGKDIGFDSVDAGPLKSARYLEPMGVLMIRLGLKLGMEQGSDTNSLRVDSKVCGDALNLIKQKSITPS